MNKKKKEEEEEQEEEDEEEKKRRRRERRKEITPTWATLLQDYAISSLFELGKIKYIVFLIGIHSAIFQEGSSGCSEPLGES